MKNLYSAFKNKVVLKSFLVILSMLLVSILFLKQLYKTEAPLKEKAKDNTAAIKILFDKGDIQFDKSEYDSALFYYNKALILCDPKINHEEYVFIVASIANIQQNNSDLIAAEATLTKTLPHLKKIKEPKYARYVYTLMAYNYYNNYDYRSAILYHRKALKFADDLFKKSIILNDIAVVYIEQKKYKEAVDLLYPLAVKKIKHKTKPLQTEYQYSLILDNLGFCYFKLGNPKAVDYLRKSLEIKLEQKDDYSSIATYKFLSMYYQNRNSTLAEMYAKKSYMNACKVNSAANKANSLAQLIKSYNGNNLKKYSLDYIKLIDSITKGRQKARNQFSRIKYDASIDKAENLHLKIQKAENNLQIERQKNRTIILYAILAVVIGAILFLIFYLSSKSKKEKKEAILKSEFRISRKLHDELAKDVFQTISFAQNKDLETGENKEHFLKSLDNIYAKTRNISKENSIIKTDKDFPFILKEMISGFKTADLNILINGFDTIQWNKINENKKIIIFRILQELFLNMKKHSKATLVSITFKIIDKNISVTYSDNGVGIGNKTLILKNGLSNVENRIKTINGTIIFDNNSEIGFKFSFTFPL
ncbi:ATP-binding protein [Flavobacterium sp. JLP]|uniref:tetratricopeptide repeat-containing sensor histidine kinase n=1 Tax=Flavobacterium sp. JLP TaxID=2783793 RepID=UPI00188C0E48|nr:tetratricopeptide repeat-containing sensor histidine kinase [Flavobacterium sp. JLP]MBF4506883.1 ATP-binding protein [Flavobacterium sp. JLP]